MCRENRGYFVRATYDGAPDGGVPVHAECLPDFWAKIVDAQWKRDMEKAYRHASKEAAPKR